MPALANVVAAAQQIGSNATQLSTGTSATAQSLSQKAVRHRARPNGRERCPASPHRQPSARKLRRRHEPAQLRRRRLRPARTAVAPHARNH